MVAGKRVLPCQLVAFPVWHAIAFDEATRISSTVLCLPISIGTNDLTQYILALDRGSENFVHLYDRFLVSTSQAIKQTVGDDLPVMLR